MTLIEAVILGIVQGITEFIPVSSSGHLALFHAMLGTSADDSAYRLLFNVTLHLGTLVAVIAVLSKEILSLLKKPFQKLTGLLLIATLPIVAAAVFLKDFVATLDANMVFLACGFIFTGLLLLYADCVKPKHLTKGLNDISVTDALTVGILQAVAIAPAISRSGSTTAGSLFRKINRRDAAKFVFLLSIPAILGAAVMEGKELLTGGIVISTGDWINFAFGFLAAALSGYLSASFVFRLIQKARLRYFSIYLFALAIFVFVDTFLLNGAVFAS